MNKSISFKLSSTNIFCSVPPPFSFSCLQCIQASWENTDSSHKISQVHKGDLQSLDETGDENKHVRAIKRDRCPETENWERSAPVSLTWGTVGVETVQRGSWRKRAACEVKRWMPGEERDKTDWDGGKKLSGTCRSGMLICSQITSAKKSAHVWTASQCRAVMVQWQHFSVSINV